MIFGKKRIFIQEYMKKPLKLDNILWLKINMKDIFQKSEKKKSLVQFGPKHFFENF